MRALPPPRAASLLALGALALCLLASCTGYGRSDRSAAQLAFGVDMAKRGLWSEALFRFHEAERADPQNPRVQNDLGVAYEAQGDFEQALQHYRKALQLAPNDHDVRANYARFVEFYQAFKGQGKGKADAAAGAPAGTVSGAAAGTTPAAGPASPAPANPPTPPTPPTAEPQPPQMPPGMNVPPPSGGNVPVPPQVPPPAPAGKPPAPPTDSGSVPPPPPVC